jgi:antitoxin VapB
MAPYVKGEEVDGLAETEAAKMALDQAEGKSTLEGRLKAIQDRVRKLGTPDPNFDEKAYTDMMWGD